MQILFFLIFYDLMLSLSSLTELESMFGLNMHPINVLCQQTKQRPNTDLR